MIIQTEDAEMIGKLLMSGWERGEGEDTNTFYWPKKLPRA